MLKLWYEEKKDGYKIYFGDYFVAFQKKKQKFSTFEVNIIPQIVDDLCEKINSGESLISVTLNLSPPSKVYFNLTDPEDNHKFETLLKNHLVSQPSGDTL